MRTVYAFFFRLFGWRVVGGFPEGLNKFIVAVAPHTSNWDFLVGVAARSILRMKHTHYLAKAQLFRPPFGWIFRKLGGHPVDRSASHDMVNQVVRLFDSHSHFILALTPEGTRKKVDRLRTGFYFIAKAAHVPIIPVGFDFSKKQVIVGEPHYTTDNMDADFQKLYAFYSRIIGKNPQNGIG